MFLFINLNHHPIEIKENARNIYLYQVTVNKKKNYTVCSKKLHDHNEVKFVGDSEVGGGGLFEAI